MATYSNTRYSQVNAIVNAATDQGVATVDDLPNTGNNAGDIQLVEGNNRMYVWNGSGWYSIAIVNTSPTWDSGYQPAASYALNADSPQDATVITLAATDPEGLPITYSHVIGGSMDSIATIGVDSSVFTITPKTIGALGEGTHTGSITFRATDGINILPQVSSFTLTFISSIVNSKYTSLLMSANAAGTNSTFTDSSSSGHTITASSTPTQGSFSPYRKGGYSLFSEKGSAGSIGTSVDDYAIKLADSSDLDAASGEDFTYEFWFKADPHPLDSLKTILTTFRNVWFGASGWYPQVVLNRYTSGAYAGKDTMSVYINSGYKDLYTEIDRSVWNHICIIRSSNVWKFYINGTEDTYQPGWVSSLYWPFTESAPVIAQGAWAGNNGVYIKDFRYVVGTAIVPPVGGPSEPLSVVSGTKFLLCSLPYLADANNTADGGLAPKTVIHGDYINKIIPSSPYDYVETSVTDGGSIEFDSTDHFIFSSLTDFDMGTNPWTVNFWFYADTQSNNFPSIFSSINYNAAGSSSIRWDNHTRANKIFMYTNGVGDPAIVTTNTLPPNQWNYVTVTRENSTDLKIYVNGSADASLTISSSQTFNFNSSGTHIGRGFSVDGGASYFHGHLTDLRIIKGTGAVQTSIPTAPLTAVTNTKLLLNGQGAKIIDRAQSANIALTGNTIGHATTKFSGAFSTYFDGTTDLATTTAGSNLNFRRGDFTVEFWINFAALGSNNYILNKQDASGNDFTLQYYNSKLSFSNQTLGGSSALYTTGIGSISTNTWYFIVVRRASDVTKMYKDGVESSSASDTHDYNRSNALHIGGYFQNLYNGNFYIQDLRWTKGLARPLSGSAYPVPTEPFKG